MHLNNQDIKKNMLVGLLLTSCLLLQGCAALWAGAGAAGGYAVAKDMEDGQLIDN